MWELIKKSKTAQSGVTTILLGIVMILFGGNPEVAKSIDGMGLQSENRITEIVSLALVGSGGMTLKGRADVEKRHKDEK